MGKILKKIFYLKETTFFGQTIEKEQILPKRVFSLQNDPQRAEPSFSDVLMYFRGN